VKSETEGNVILGPNPAAMTEINNALQQNSGVLGKVARVMADGVTSPTEMASLGAGANSGHSGNMARIITCIQTGSVPTAPSRAALAARAIGGLLRDNPNFSGEATTYLQGLRQIAESVEKDDEAIAGEQTSLLRASEELTERVEKLGGVYVYSFPTYLKVPAKYDPERFWLKIGQTGRVVEKRVSDQLRSTAMPEDPVILRVYTDSKGAGSNSEVDYSALEKRFHKLLMSAGHSKTSARSGGTEWFATTLEFLDEIAETLNLEIENRDLD
jgi:hypothetical protein